MATNNSFSPFYTNTAPPHQEVESISFPLNPAGDLDLLAVQKNMVEETVCQFRTQTLLSLETSTVIFSGKVRHHAVRELKLDY